MLPTLERGVAALQRRRFRQRWIEGLAAHGQVALFAAGGAVLLARVLWRWESDEAAVLFALAAVALVTSLLRARRGVPSADAAAAWLDVRAGARGQIVTETELGPSAWSQAARAQLERSLASLPRLEGRRAARALVPALVFAALALWVPIPRVALGPPPLLATAALEELTAKLETLEETLDLPPETAEELAARLERIAAAADAGEPASAFEAIDRLGERLDAEAQRALEAAQRALPDLASAAGDPSLAEAQAALDAALSSLGEAGLARDLPPAVQQALVPGSLSLPPGTQLSSAALAKLSTALKGVLDERVAGLAAGRLLDAKALREWKPGTGSGGLGEFDPEHVCDEDCKKPGGT